MSLLPGTNISVGLLILPLGFSMLVEGKFSKQVSFMGTGISAGCLISYLGFRLPVEGGFFECLFGCQSFCWEDAVLMRFLPEASLPCGFLISCLGVRVPVGKTFS